MKTAVQLPEAVAERLQRKGNNISDIIAQSLERYDTLLEDTSRVMAGRFSLGEVTLLYDIFKTTRMDSTRIAMWPTLLGWDVEEVEKYENLGAGAGIDTEALVTKLEGLTTLQALWLWEKIELTRMNPELHGEHRETLRLIFGTSD